MDSLQGCSQPSEKDAFTSTLKQNFSLYSKCFDSDIWVFQDPGKQRFLALAETESMEIGI